jgi:hypothetical protein
LFMNRSWTKSWKCSWWCLLMSMMTKHFPDENCSWSGCWNSCTWCHHELEGVLVKSSPCHWEYSRRTALHYWLYVCCSDRPDRRCQVGSPARSWKVNDQNEVLLLLHTHVLLIVLVVQFGNIALHEAEYCNSHEVIKVLVATNADVH